MPSVAQRKKATGRSTVLPAAPSKQKGIQAFSKVTKVQVHEVGKSELKRKHLEPISAPNGPLTPEVHESKKRKFPTELEKFDSQEVQQRVEHAVVPGSRKRKVSGGPATPPPPEQATKRSKTVTQSHKLTETPTKGARSLLEKFALDRPSSSAGGLSSSRAKYETPPSSPPSVAEDEGGNLPDELQDLINLHSSFLTALSFYYAHNGLSNPADLRNLYPGVERIWRKRGVNIDDIRRILATTQQQQDGLEDKDEGLFHLFDYGNNKICVEVSDHALQSHRHIINEPALNQSFVKTLTEKWSLFQKLPTIGQPSPSAFLSHLPLLPITPSASLTDLKPLLAKGQTRLLDLKTGALAAQSRNSALGPTSSTSTSTSSTDPTISTKSKNSSAKTRANNLLDRLSAKAHQNSTLPSPPTPAQAARKRALQRLPEIAPVLQSLALGAQKHDSSDVKTASLLGDMSSSSSSMTSQQRQHQISFPLAGLVTDFQTSLRNPISKDEAVACVRCLAEVVPEWVSVWEVGTLVGVVVKGAIAVGRVELERKVEVVIGREGL